MSSSRSSNEKDYEKGSLTINNEERSSMLDEKNSSADGSALPSPVIASNSPSKPKLSATAIIPIWIVLSSSVIIYNNYLYNTLQFRFPVFLVTWHLTFAVSPLVCHSLCPVAVGIAARGAGSIALNFALETIACGAYRIWV